MKKKEVEKDLSIEYKLESGLNAIAYPDNEIYDYLVQLQKDNKPLIVPNDKFFKGIEFKTKIPWNWKIGVSNVTNKFNTIAIPSMPKTFGKEYDFPETANVTSQELGEWMMRISSWKAYSLKLLAKADVERIILDESYDTIISKGLAVADKAGKKVTKDVIIGSSLTEVEGFRDIRIKLIEKKAEVESLKRIIEIYSTQLDAISREISRRSMEYRVVGQGL